jgi:hypothetical protein
MERDREKQVDFKTGKQTGTRIPERSVIGADKGVRSSLFYDAKPALMRRKRARCNSLHHND